MQVMRSIRVTALTERLHVDLRRQASSLCRR
ncbi:putative leader peptide [Actinokineospora sp. UTMC 2448]